MNKETFKAMSDALMALNKARFETFADILKLQEELHALRMEVELVRHELKNVNFALRMTHGANERKQL